MRERKEEDGKRKEKYIDEKRSATPALYAVLDAGLSHRPHFASELRDGISQTALLRSLPVRNATTA